MYEDTECIKRNVYTLAVYVYAPVKVQYELEMLNYMMAKSIFWPECTHPVPLEFTKISGTNCMTILAYIFRQCF